MKMQELLIFVLILAGGAYIFLGAANSETATAEGCEINQTEGGGTVNYSGPDGCTLEFNVFDTTGAKNVADVCNNSSTKYPCGEPWVDCNEDQSICAGDDAWKPEMGNDTWNQGEKYTDTNKDKRWTQSLYTFNWWEEVVVRGKKERSYLAGNENEPWKLSYSSAATGRITIGIDVIDNYATSMNGEISSDTHKWSLKFNRKHVPDPNIKLSGKLEIKAN